MHYRHITIEGNIGSGKTSLAQMLARDYGGKLILEQFADNPFLPDFYRDPRTYAFPLELFFLAERYQQLKSEAAIPDLFKALVVSDYLFAKSSLFASINLNEDELRLYQRLSGIMQSTLPDPELVLFLHMPVHRLLKNIAVRGRIFEQQISAEYLEKIQHRYFELFRSLQHLRILIVDAASLDFVNNREHYSRIIGELEKQHPTGISNIVF